MQCRLKIVHVQAQVRLPEWKLSSLHSHSEYLPKTTCLAVGRLPVLHRLAMILVSVLTLKFTVFRVAFTVYNSHSYFEGSTYKSLLRLKAYAHIETIGRIIAGLDHPPPMTLFSKQSISTMYNMMTFVIARLLRCLRIHMLKCSYNP